MVHFVDEENIVTKVDFDCGNTFYSEAPKRVGQFNGEQKNFSRYCEKPSCITQNK